MGNSSVRVCARCARTCFVLTFEGRGLFIEYLEYREFHTAFLLLPLPHSNPISIHSTLHAVDARRPVDKPRNCGSRYRRVVCSGVERLDPLVNALLLSIGSPIAVLVTRHSLSTLERLYIVAPAGA